MIAILGVDIHCHILPNIDDGPKNIDESIEMSQSLVEEGLSIVVATPHYTAGDPLCNIDKINDCFKALTQALKRKIITVKLLRGAEILVSPLLANMDADELRNLSINASRYLLIEMPALVVPSYTDDIIYDIQLKGFTPIIAHPERNAAIMNDPTIAYTLVEQGALLQLNAGSIAGRFGKASQKLAYLFIKHNLAQFIATDGHSAHRRAPRMMESFSLVEDAFDRNMAMRLWIDNPTAAIYDNSISIEKITPLHKRFFGGWK